MKGFENNLQVVIVGGSIAGLTLAHCFEQTGIDYVLLEAHARIAPQLGASIALLPNGCVLLDQLGLWDEIEKLFVPMVRTKFTVEGKYLGESDSMELVQERLGYASGFLDRQVLLQVLYDRLPDKSKIKVNKRMTSIEHTDTGVIVQCEDGSRYVGDVVVGADGIHSKTRREMWRRFDLLGKSQLITEDKTATFSDYKMLFGISSGISAIRPGDLHRVYNVDWSAFVAANEGGRCYWFFFEKHEKKYQAPNIPRYKQADVDSFVETFKDRVIVGDTTFQHYWDSRVSYGLVALDEGWPKHWTVDRIACVGDSAHKMTVHSGQGGNNAIESAAALTNCLLDMMASCQGSAPSLEEINHALNAYESNRRHRAREFCVSASLQTRLEAMNTFKDKLKARYLLTFGGDMIADQITNRITGAVLVKRLPFPERALKATLPYNIKAGVGYEESKKLRALLAIPLLGVAYYAHRTFSGQLSDLSQLTGLRRLYLLQDLIPLEVIWTIEGLRRANSITLPPLGPTLWTALSQLLGLHVVAPVYNFFHFTLTPLEKTRAPDQRMVPTGDAKVIIPAVALGWLTPTVLLSLWPEAPSSAVKLLRFFPLWTAVAHCSLKATVKDTTKRDRIHAPKSDLPFLRGAYLVAGCFSAALHNYLRFFSPTVGGSGSTALLSLMTPAECTSHIMICSSWFFWEALHFWDLKKARKAKFGLVKVFTGLATGSMLFGPAAALTFGWYWREEILASDKRLSLSPWPSAPKLDTEMTDQKELA